VIQQGSIIPLSQCLHHHLCGIRGAARWETAGLCHAACVGDSAWWQLSPWFSSGSSSHLRHQGLSHLVLQLSLLVCCRKGSCSFSSFVVTWALFIMNAFLRGGCIPEVGKASPPLAVWFSAGQAAFSILITSSTTSAFGDSCLFAACAVCLGTCLESFIMTGF